MTADVILVMLLLLLLLCCSWGCSCYQIFSILKLFHFTTDRLQNFVRKLATIFSTKASYQIFNLSLN